jgi:diguanylate cyclase (GGDEF)-like protein
MTSRRTPPLTDVAPLGDDVRPIGLALGERAAEVLELTGLRARALGHARDQATVRSYERINKSSTLAIARWLSGAGPAAAREAGRETWRLYGELAARRTVSLHELAERHLCWRDSVVEVIRDAAAALRVADETLSEALNAVQIGVELSFVGMCKSFDRERLRTDAELAASREELAYRAAHDELTGLPNRTLIVDRIDQMLARSARSGAPVAAMSIDIDSFKTVNDTLGHLVADELLRAVASRLDDVLRGSDTLGRLGGNEFIAICEGPSLDAGAELIAERLLEALKSPFSLPASAHLPLTLTASIGIATGKRSSAEELLRDANVAMYRAKRTGRNRYVFYETGMQRTIRRRAELELGLRQALERDELFLAYQPMVRLADLRVVAVEALVRWRHPLRGLIAPSDFIPLAEDTGVIVELGSWAMREACTQGAAWRRAGYHGQVAVNVSARQLDSEQLVSDIEAALTDTAFAEQQLVLEITETALMHNVEDTIKRLRLIKALGPRIAIDDFGTGYSSFAHLQRFPVDTLKIDRSFVARLGRNPDASAFIHTLTQLGKALSIETVAEGIERRQELVVLTAEECQVGQGFLFARPLNVPDAEAVIFGRSPIVVHRRQRTDAPGLASDPL